MQPGIYRHHKGKLYHVLGVALHSETEEKLVVYRALYGSADLWVRPMKMFQEKVRMGKKIIPRFQLVDWDTLLQKKHPQAL